MPPNESITYITHNFKINLFKSFTIDKMASLLKTTKSELMNHEPDSLVPELQYMKEFSNPDNLDRILDLMDEYVELREVV